jgi:predicted peptidase
MKYKIILFLLIIIFSCCKSESNNRTAKLKDSIATQSNLTDTVKKIFTDTLLIEKKESEYNYGKYNISETDSILFRVLIPLNYDTNAVYPLLIFFHGSGERGSDNEAQLINGGKLFSDEINRQEYNSFVVFPQCPENEKWVDVDWSAESSFMKESPTKPLENSIKLINKLIKEFKIDTKRLYVMGLSMGGYATWDIICRLPDKFAAAVPICGGGDENKAFDIVRVPIWAFHGSKDKTVKTHRSRNMVNAIKQQGGFPKYTEYPGVGHNCWDLAFEEEGLLEWVFSQTKAKLNGK